LSPERRKLKKIYGTSDVKKNGHRTRKEKKRGGEKKMNRRGESM